MAKLSKDSEGFMQGLLEAFRTGGHSAAVRHLQDNQAILQKEASVENKRLADANYKATLEAERKKKEEAEKKAKEDAKSRKASESSTESESK